MSSTVPWGAPIGWLFLLSLPLILWFHLRRRQRRRTTVASVTPWLALSVARPQRRAIPATVLLALHLLAAALLASAIASPFVPGPPQSTTDRVVVLDVTTSMAAGDRWAQATETAHNLLSSTPGAFSLVTLGPRPRALVVRDPDETRARDAIAQLAPGGTGADLPAAVRMARAVGGPGAEVVVITDGGIDASGRAGAGDTVGVDGVSSDTPGDEIVASNAGTRARSADGDGQEGVAEPFASTPPTPNGPWPDRWVLVGSQVPNTAVVSVGRGNETDRREVFARVARFGDEGVRVPLSLSLDGTVVDERIVALGAGGVYETVWRVPAGAAAAQVRVDGNDALPWDDAAWVPLEPRPLRVELVGSSVPLERALASIPGVSLVRAGEASYRTDGTVDVSVFAGMVPPELPPGGVVLVGVEHTPWSRGDARSGSVGLDIASPHEITRGLDVRGATVGRARPLEVPSWAATTLTAEGAPVAFAGRREGRGIAVMSIDPDGGDLATRLAFPLLVARTVDWVVATQVPSVVSLGAPVRLPPGTHDVRGPDVFERGARGEFRATGLPGAYSATTARAPAPRVVRFGVMAGDPIESNTMRRGALPTAAVETSAATATPQRALWPWLAVLAVATMLAEGLWRARGRSGRGP